MLASCKNCLHHDRACTIGLKPDNGELYCKRYAMTVAFREEVLSLMRTDIQREISQARIMIQMNKAEKAQTFAG